MTLCAAFVALPRHVYRLRPTLSMVVRRLSFVISEIRKVPDSGRNVRVSLSAARWQRWQRLFDALSAPLRPERMYTTLHRAPAQGRATAWIVSLTPVTDEPRVLRQSKMLHDAGWNVVVVGYLGKSPKPEFWSLLEVVHGSTPQERLSIVSCRAALVASPASTWLAEYYYWTSAGYSHIYRNIVDAFDRTAELGCDLVVAHDYYTTPIAARFARLCGVEYVVDCHEYATGQYMHDAEWRRRYRPWVHAIQKRFLPRAAVVTTVCDGIARLLDEEYRLRSPVKVVRSTPTFIEMPYRAVGETIEVLYHGILDPIRGLDLAIRSVPLWRPEFRLAIRGPGPAEYIEELKRLSREYGVQDRVIVEPPVLFGEMIKIANRSDIGYFVHEDISPQKKFVLPNKLFEYVMAGLAICVSDLPEMAKIVLKHDLGRLVTGTSPQQIANVINQLSREDIDRYKRNSIIAARELCWEKESHAMQAAYDSLL